ncbi:MAG TPA: hypothetical protein VM791_06650 [Vicinamibacterales bacterium]|nr:hypothetical protein [Vicinamibacterales bacterium]
MRVDPERDRGVGVPELLRHVRDRRTSLEQETRERVAQVMDAPRVQLGLRQHPREDVAHVALLEGGASPRRKDPIGQILPLLQPSRLLTPPPREQCLGELD